MPTTSPDEYKAAIAAHNERTRARLAGYLAAHGRVWIGKINVYPPARAELVPYTGELAPNLEPDFAVPKPDGALLRLIIKRQEAPYTGPADDAVRLDDIFACISALDGLILTWR